MKLVATAFAQLFSLLNEGSMKISALPTQFYRGRRVGEEPPTESDGTPLIQLVENLAF